MDQQTGLTAQDYRQAIDVQDACNLSGVVHTFSKVMTKIWEEARTTGSASTEWVNQHPISVLYASKILSLTRAEPDGRAFANAYNVCRDRSRETESHS